MGWEEDSHELRNDLKGFDDRLRQVELASREYAAHWARQKDDNKAIGDKIGKLFARLEDIPTEAEMSAIEEKVTTLMGKVDTAANRQTEILQHLERKKGREDIIKIIITALITLGTGLVLWALTK